MLAESMISTGEAYNGTIIALGKYATYAHSSYKISTKGDEHDNGPFICAWDKPFAVFDDGKVTINRASLGKQTLAMPKLCLPLLDAVRIEDVVFSRKYHFHQFLDAEAIVYLGTGDGNFPGEWRSTMALLSTQFHKPQFVCSGVPKRSATSAYEAGVAPDGVIQSVLPVTATYAKLAVILRQAQILTGKIKQEFVLRCFEESMVGEYRHLQK